MKATETKSTHSQQHDAAETSFFNQRQENTFFSEPTTEQTAFFQPGGIFHVQPKMISGSRSFFQPSRVPNIQAKCAECEAEERQQEEDQGDMPEIQQMPAFESDEVPVQAKLTVGQPGDRYEQEADRVAATVVNKINNPGLGNLSQPHFVQTSFQGNSEFQQGVFRQAVDASVPNLQADFETALNRTKGGGSPLDNAFRAKVEPAMGADFSGVKVHTDAKADRLNRSIQAKAFTTGQDIFFRQGAYEPGSHQGQKLLAHELSHVVQQSSHQANHLPVNLIQRDDGEEEEPTSVPRVGEQVGSWMIREVNRDWRDVVTLTIVNLETGDVLHESPWHWRHRRARYPHVQGSLAMGRLGESVARGVAAILERGFPVSGLIAQGISSYLYSIAEEEAPETEAEVEAEGAEIPETTSETEPSGSEEETEERPLGEVILNLPSTTLFEGWSLPEEDGNLFDFSTGGIPLFSIPLEQWGIPADLLVGGEARAQAQVTAECGPGILRHLRLRLSRTQALVLQSALALSERRLEYLIPLLPILGEFEAYAQLFVPAHIGASLLAEGSLSAAINAAMIEIVSLEGGLDAGGEARVNERFVAPVHLRSQDGHLTFSVDRSFEIDPHLMFNLGAFLRVILLRTLLGSRPILYRHWNLADWEWSHPLTLGTRLNMDYDNGLDEFGLDELNYVDFEARVLRVQQLLTQLLEAGPQMMSFNEENGDGQGLQWLRSELDNTFMSKLTNLANENVLTRLNNLQPQELQPLVNAVNSENIELIQELESNVPGLQRVLEFIFMQFMRNRRFPFWHRQWRLSARRIATQQAVAIAQQRSGINLPPHTDIRINLQREGPLNVFYSLPNGRGEGWATWLILHMRWNPEDIIDWETLTLREEGEEIAIRMSSTILQSEAAIEYVLGHEMYEIQQVYEFFSSNNFAVSVNQLMQETNNAHNNNPYPLDEISRSWSDVL